MERTTFDSEPSLSCEVCIFYDICSDTDRETVCRDFYAEGFEEWASAREERELKIEYLEAWRDYTEGF